MSKLHKDLTGSDLHEPKGVDSASANTVYISDGSGSGSWTKVTKDTLDSSFTTTSTSVTLGSTSFQLVNDSATPGSSYYYGTDSLGNKGWYSLPSGSGGSGSSNIVVYDSAGSYTYTVPAGLAYVEVIVVGGGGSGGGNSGPPDHTPLNGGGAGAYAAKIISAASLASYTSGVSVSVGTGGVSGSNGSSSSFGPSSDPNVYVHAGGGLAGPVDTTSSPAASNAGDIRVYGGLTDSRRGGVAPVFGVGKFKATKGVDGGPGDGGYGGSTTNSGNDGIVIIREYYV